MKTLEKLKCYIVESRRDLSLDTAFYKYEVRNSKGEVVALGASSSLNWVKHDAGGYHTKEKFDELYPHGWEVEFAF